MSTADMTNFHIHHILPKHMGGETVPDNLKKLSVKDHAEAHKTLYDQYGKTEDYIAWKALSGQISMSEASIEAWKLGSKKGGISNATNKTGICGRSKEKMTADGRKAAQHPNNPLKNPQFQQEMGKRGRAAIAEKRSKSPEWWNEVCRKIGDKNKGRVPGNKTDVYCIFCRQRTQPSRIVRSHRSCRKKFPIAAF